MTSPFSQPTASTGFSGCQRSTVGWWGRPTWQLSTNSPWVSTQVKVHNSHHQIQGQKLSVWIHLLQIQIYCAPSGGAAGGHRQYGKSWVPVYLGRKPIAVRSLNTVVKIHRHVPTVPLWNRKRLFFLNLQYNSFFYLPFQLCHFTIIILWLFSTYFSEWRTFLKFSLFVIHYCFGSYSRLFRQINNFRTFAFYLCDLYAMCVKTFYTRRYLLFYLFFHYFAFLYIKELSLMENPISKWNLKS